MAAARIDESAEIALAAHVGLQRLAIEQARRLVAVVMVQFMDPLRQFAKMPRFGRDVHVIRAVVAIDAVVADQGLGQIERFDRQIEQAARILGADLGGQRLLARRQAEDGLPAAAAGSAVADEARLEQRHPIAALGQVQRGRAAGYAAADDADVGAPFALQSSRAAGSRLRDSRRRSTRQRAENLGALDNSLQTCLFKILWLLTGIGSCEPSGLFGLNATLPRRSNRC